MPMKPIIHDNVDLFSQNTAGFEPGSSVPGADAMFIAQSSNKKLSKVHKQSPNKRKFAQSGGYPTKSDKYCFRVICKYVVTNIFLIFVRNSG
jgi:hypothetical protein